MSGKTLLFADDSVTMRMVMEKTFQAEPIRIAAVPSGQAAIEKAKEIIPDIVIADAGMTGINGYDVCEAIRQNPSTAHIPVIIMSGISNPYDEIKGDNVQATDHMKKPFDTTKLIERVDELCSMMAQPVSPPQRPPLPLTMVNPSGVSQEAKSFIKPERPSASQTLHAFPKPVEFGGKKETVPVAHNPFASSPAESPVHKKSEPAPIELDDDGSGEPIQVGTLAELAQMNEKGETIEQEKREDAIEIETDVSRITLEPEPDSIAPKSIAPELEENISPEISAKVRAVTSEKIAEAVDKVDGLSKIQAQMILTLTEEIVEKVVWEVVPDLAETIIREKIEQLLK